MQIFADFEMKIIALLCGIGILATGCHRHDAKTYLEEAKASGALKMTAANAEVVVANHTVGVTNVSSLRDALHHSGDLVDLEAFGSSNVFFNPDFSKWNSPPNSDEFAIVLRRSYALYFGIRFNWQLCKTQDCPVAWIPK
jgi:hypothetical protein